MKWESSEWLAGPIRSITIRIVHIGGFYLSDDGVLFILGDVNLKLSGWLEESTTIGAGKFEHSFWMSFYVNSEDTWGIALKFTERASEQSFLSVDFEEMAPHSFDLDIVVTIWAFEDWSGSGWGFISLHEGG